MGPVRVASKKNGPINPFDEKPHHTVTPGKLTWWATITYGFSGSQFFVAPGALHAWRANYLQSTSPDADTTRSTTVPPTTEFSIESVVIPEAGLRIWHIAALAILLILIVIVITCCCIDIRIPRTVQQIEKTDRKLKLNKQYIKELSRAASSSTPAPPGRVTSNRRETQR
ncbi:uncharacterized protein LOC118765236 [Octopus sinensis]|uniref:Uncharacterized protein LOC118765236 n=1 Tax=Octopus sinensis TaxID=2607531 RepID=A0A7E6F5R9_9MOLL|nr:uncharacterized protein LOC118765236 [Octopus sinensis]